jgi:hypothetical protein
LLTDLGVEDWRVQNQTVRRIEPWLGGLRREQRLQLGRGLVSAANNGALDPAEFFERLVGSDAYPRTLRSDVMIGALAEVYLAETGEPKKPLATRGIAATFYRYHQIAELGEAYDVVLGRLRPLRREYLALPREDRREIQVLVAQQNGLLVNISTEHAALLEENAPGGRLLQRTGGETELTLEQIIELVAEEFILPVEWLTTDVSGEASLIVPERLGFAAWGPRSGIQLR